MHNPLLLQELVEKLPPHYKVQWAQHKNQIGYANVQTFAMWLECLANAIATVQPYIHSASKEKFDLKPKRVNVHSEVEDKVDSQIDKASDGDDTLHV